MNLINVLAGLAFLCLALALVLAVSAEFNPKLNTVLVRLAWVFLTIYTVLIIAAAVSFALA